MAHLPPPASLPTPGTSAATHLELFRALRHFQSSELHELVDCLRRSDAAAEAAARALINDMLPPRKGYSPAFPVEPIKRFGAAELRELALILCLVAPAAQAVALVEIDRLQLVGYGWCGRGDGGSGSGGGSDGGFPWWKTKKHAHSESPTVTATTTTPSTEIESGFFSPSAETPVNAGESGGSAKAMKEKRRRTRRKKFKQAILSFLDSMEYAHDGNIYRG